MTDLSKELGEIKRQHERDVFRSPCPEKAHNDRAALLHIIETEIPGMLRAEAVGMDKAKIAAENDDNFEAVIAFQLAAQKFRTFATLIESLTKDTENTHG